jgi:hypothetical protein
MSSVASAFVVAEAQRRRRIVAAARGGAVEVLGLDARRVHDVLAAAVVDVEVGPLHGQARDAARAARLDDGGVDAVEALHHRAVVRVDEVVHDRRDDARLQLGVKRDVPREARVAAFDGQDHELLIFAIERERIARERGARIVGLGLHHRRRRRQLRRQIETGQPREHVAADADERRVARVHDQIAAEYGDAAVRLLNANVVEPVDAERALEHHEVVLRRRQPEPADLRLDKAERIGGSVELRVAYGHRNR